MTRRSFFFVVIISWLFFTMTATAYAFTILTEEQALREVFGEGAQTEKETKELKGDDLLAIQKRLGGRLVWYQEGSESAKVATSKTFNFYFASKEGKRFGVAIIDVEPGRWGPVTFITAMTLNGAVKKVRVMEYVEKRGRPIARRSFMRQYVGKTSKSTLQVGKDITSISGATISSRAATFSVTKAILVYKAFYLK